MRIRTIVEDYEARLAPADGSLGVGGPSGKAEWEPHGNGEIELEIKVRNLSLPDGAVIEAVLGGDSLGAVPVRKGRAKLVFESRDGETVPSVSAGQILDLRLGEILLLRGVFIPD